MNINRDYLIINDVKKSNVKLDNGSIFFYITDKNTQNIFVNLVINVSNNDLIQKYANIENAEDYTLTMNIVKPSNTYKIVEGKLHDKEKAIFEFNLNEDCCDEIGTYRCELLTKCTIDGHEEITTSNKLTYKVKSSVLNDLDDIVEAPEYPLVIQLFDKLSDIEQYEEDRRANELARQLAEEQRQTRFNELNADIDNKMTDIENRIVAKEEAVDTLINDTKANIDEYKVAKDQEIDDYKAAKDTEINEAIANQNTTINAQNDKISAVENNVVAQNDKLDTLETKATTHEARITAVETKNTEQDNRLDIAENRLANIGNDITNTMQPIIDGHTSRLDAIEAINVAQNTRLDSIEVKNQQQDDRLLDIEKVNKKQEQDIKCLFNFHTVDITEEGNSVYLPNSAEGYCEIDNIQGNTLVNCNKEPDKEITLNGNINTQGYSNVTLTEGVDGGLVDVALEGNTMVNVCDQKDPVAITKSYTVETGNHVALQGEYNGKCRPVVTGNTLVNLIDNFNRNIGQANSCVANNKGFTLTKTQDGGITYFKYNLKHALDESKKYTIIYDIVENTLLNTNKDYGIYVDAVYGALVTKTTTRGSADGKLGKIISVHNVYPGSNNLDYLSIAIHQGDAGGKLVIDNLMLLEGDYSDKPIPDYFEGLQSSFEDNLVTQEMVDSGEELAENLGKYKVDYVISREDGTVGQTKTFYLNSPLLEGDTIEQQGNNVVHVHRSELRAYETDDELTLPTDMTNTLVAKATPQYEVISQNDTILCDSYVNGHLDVDSVVPIERVKFLPFEKDLTYLYANTQYTVQIVSDKAVTVDITLGGTKLLAQSIVIGLNRITITTPSTLVDNKLIINGVGANISEVVVSDTDRKFGYFEGMKSVGEGGNLVITSSNSNNSLSNTQTLTHAPLRSVGETKDRYVLLNGNWYIERKCGIRAHQEGDKDNYKTDLINTVYPLEMPTYDEIDYNPLEVYSGITHITTNSTISCNIIVKNHGYNCLLKPNTTYTVASNLGLNTVTAGADIGDSCLRFYDTDTSDVTTMKDVLVLEGDWTSKSDLIPANFNGIESAFEQEYDTEKGKYKVNVKVANEDKTRENNITFYINEPLRGVGNVKDRVYVKDDKIIVERNCSSVTFDGSDDEDWDKFGKDNFTNITRYSIKLGGEKANSYVLSDKFSKKDYRLNEEFIFIGGSSFAIFGISKTKIPSQNTMYLRQWLQQNPTTVVYQLAEPTYEEVEYNDVKLFIESFKNSTLFYNSNVPVTSKVWYSYSVPIVDTVAQTANVTDQQDSMIIDLAAQCAVMEMMLM